MSQGPITRDQFQAIWKGAVDDGYSEPLLRAGDGGGLEVYSQEFAVFARASRAIEISTQAMYVLPWSGQSEEPAPGAEKAVVMLTFTRTRRTDVILVLRAGETVAEEIAVDASAQGGVSVQTGRRYILREDVVFFVGDVGPHTVEAEAERVGYGYNNPLPETISAIPQPGKLFENDLASIPGATGGLLNQATARIVCPNEPDMFVLEQVGQFIEIVGGLNSGIVVQARQFVGPDPSVPVGSTMYVRNYWAITGTSFALDFIPGETVAFVAAGVEAIAVGQRTVAGVKQLIVELQGDRIAWLTVAVGESVQGDLSGATLTIAHLLVTPILQEDAPIAGVGGVAWRMFDWKEDGGVVVTNAASPSGGKAAWLDALGKEKNIFRGSGESNDQFRERVAKLADTVSPAAMKRALNRTLGGIPWCFREVGTDEFRGFFYDGDEAPVGGDQSSNLAAADRLDAYDTDVFLFKPSAMVSFTVGEPLALELTAGGFSMRIGTMGRTENGTWFSVLREPGSSLPVFAAGWQLRGIDSGVILTGLTGWEYPDAAIARRWRTWLSFAEMRAYFLVGVPAFAIGEFGMAYDVGTRDAYDARIPIGNAWDGYPANNFEIYQRVFNSIDPKKVGGVGWELYQERIGCP